MTDDSGLWLKGTVISRRRRRINLKDSDKVRYMINIRIMANNEILVVDRWADTPAPADIPLVGSEFNQRVSLRIFNTKSGAKASLQWGTDADEGEF